MTRFRNSIFKILLEAKVHNFEYRQSPSGMLRVIRNPSEEEYNGFKNNTKYKAIRGIVVHGDVYICDAAAATHLNLFNVIEQEIYDIYTDIDSTIEDNEDPFGDENLLRRGLEAEFEEDELGTLQIRYRTSKYLSNLNNIFSNRRDVLDSHNSGNTTGYFSTEGY